MNNAMQPLVTSVTTVAELVKELKNMPKGATWRANSGGFGFCSVTVFDKGGNQICEIVNKG